MYYSAKKKMREVSHNSYFLRAIYLKLNTLKTYALSGINDENFAKIKYKENTGKTLNLKNPVYFNEKLWWLKINYRTPLMTECSDKIKVRDYIKRLNLGFLLNDLKGVYSQAENIPLDKLQGKFFIKCNHVSGINTVFDSNRKGDFDYRGFIKEFNNALNMNYYYQAREWNYKNIEPKILIEDFIESQSQLLDYRFFCFHGEVKLIFVDIDTASNNGKHNPDAKRNIYDRNFMLQDFTVGRDNFDESLVKEPEGLKLMIQYAEKISSPFIFCRVDLYNIDGDIKFGEITFYPGGATQQFSSRKRDLEVASWLDLSRT